MGSRKGRSAELAIRLVTSQVQEVWKYDATASLEQIDIQGAFDCVDYIRLLDALREKGYPGWIVRWVRTFLVGRTAGLYIDAEESAVIPVRVGVPQGSPLSPILYILYMAPLYELLSRSQKKISIADQHSWLY
jgi:hypothetical protein